MKDAIKKKNNQFKGTTENGTVITAPYPTKELKVF